MVFGLPCGRAFGGLFRVFDGGLEWGLLVGFAVGGGAEGLGGAGGGGAEGLGGAGGGGAEGLGGAGGGGAEGLGGAGGGGAAGGGLSCSSATVSFTGTVRPL